MIQVQNLERTFALHGIDGRIDPALEALLAPGVQHKIAVGDLAPTPCGYCRRLLTDPVSILRGYGPECEKKVQAERDAAARLPVGAEVLVVGGPYEGTIGVIGGYHPRRKGRVVKRPFTVEFGGYRADYAADQLERLEGAE